MLLLLIACAPKSDDTATAWSYPLDDVLRVTDGQVIGTHNSYHLRDDPMVTDEWDYAHLPLDRQASEQGVRQFELDVHQELDGSFSVYHAIGLDDESSCPTLGECLSTLRAWSDANPAHFPIFILIEPKDDVGGEPIDVDLLDAALLDVWPDPFTPAELKGDSATVRDAVVDTGWPLLGAVRGRAVFALLDQAQHRDAYTGDGRPMFKDVDADDPDAAFLLLDDPTDAGIGPAVEAGFLVRTFIDEDLGPEISEDGGAHMLSTDFPDAYPLPDGDPVRCNPVHAPEGCTAAALEDRAFLSD